MYKKKAQLKKRWACTCVRRAQGFEDVVDTSHNAGTDSWEDSQTALGRKARL
jgi:hypothetical protein